MSQVDTSTANAWSALLDYYASHRNTVADLYPSERVFLPNVVSKVSSVLDVGCAVGGFSRIMRELNPAIRYVGVDSNPLFVQRARRENPGIEFHVGDGITFPFELGTFELVHCSGVLHLTRDYARMIAAMWRQSSRFLLADMRLTSAAGVEGRMRIADDMPELPYFVVNAGDAVELFRSLTPPPARVDVRGYPHLPSSSATLPEGTDVSMAFFLAEQGEADATAVNVSLLPEDESR